jgi:transcriptional regulator with XRE-family HTH domain
MAKGWSQDLFSDKSGIHRTHIGAIERGERNVTPRTIRTLPDRGILIRVSHGLDCKRCVYLAERYQEAVEKLVRLSQKLSILAGARGDHQQFERLLEETRGARRECKDILADFEQHRAGLS